LERRNDTGPSSRRGSFKKTKPREWTKKIEKQILDAGEKRIKEGVNVHISKSFMHKINKVVGRTGLVENTNFLKQGCWTIQTQTNVISTKERMGKKKEKGRKRLKTKERKGEGW